MSKGPLILGIVLVIVGVLSLIGNLTDIPTWPIFWASVLILIGAWMIFRPRMIPAGVAIDQRVLGDIRRKGTWQVRAEEIWLGLGDVHLDLTEAEVPEGQTKISVYGFVGSLKVDAPETVGVSIASTAFLTEGRVLGEHQQRFLGTLERATDNYPSAERQVQIEATYFVVDLRVRRV